jgi:aminopeptidase N
MAMLVPAGAQAAPKPDMQLRGISEPPDHVETGAGLEVSGKVRNKGNAPGDAIITATLSDSATPQPGAVELGETTVTALAPRTDRDFDIDGVVPESTPEGTYYQVVCVPKRGIKGQSKCKADSSPIEVSGADFQPGARTLGDPLFPQTGNGGYDVQHYDLELDYDPETNLFEDGTRTTITAKATQDLSELSLDFQDLPVSGVTVDGAAATFTQEDAEPPLSDNPAVTQPMKLIVTPAEGIRQGEEFELVVSYTGEPRVITDADESIEGWIPACYPGTVPAEDVCDGGFTVNQPNGSQGWFPGNHYPTDKATFDTSITVPAGTTAFGMGELASTVPNAGTGEETWNWSSAQPASSYLATATNGDFIYEAGSIPEVSTGRTLDTYHGIDSSATPGQLDSVQASIRRMRGQLNFLSERVLGPYPFDSMGVVADRVAGVGYALENQTKAHFAGAFSGSGPSVSVTTLLHEVAHQWIGNSVAIETWPDLWFNEGWATWLTWYWAYEDNSSTTSPAEQWQANYDNPSNDWSQAPATLDEPEELFSTFPVYTRGAMTLEGYRQIIGDDAFFAFSEKLAQQFADDNISTEEFIDFALAESGLSGADLQLLDDYFQQWLYGSTKPDITAEDF